MFVSTLQLIAQLASNPLYIFCFCNLMIIVIILIGSSSGSIYDEESQVPLSRVSNACSNAKHSTPIMHQLDVNEMVSVDLSKQSNPAETQAPICQEKRSYENKEKNYNNEEDDVEFRRRVEEFIDKVNRGWRAELQRAL
ncbi:conserved hypothetical protein [Ricinus communis]|uniref:Uncharacterized protein n=1 Tax=Ricinus communis TaxID=3988 RepID=B9RJI6_RICCO|nr:conserved hypothetical protein [Ricinus communis]|eukprot:XP_025012182.1 uncharacterized protein LOC112533941 [Ricinus communis]